MTNQYIKGITALTLSISCFTLSAATQEPTWQTCAIQKKLTVDTNLNSLTSPLPSLPKGAVLVEADDGFIKAKGISTLEGNVIIQQGEKIIRADKASYNNKNSNVTAFGNVLLTTESMKLKSSEISYNMKNSKGTIKDAEYTLTNGQGHGSSKLLKQNGKDLTQLSSASFSTCPPNHRSWHIASSDIKLNHGSQIGSARNVTFKAGNIPLFYSPYFSFPLNNQRKSGFLAPGFAVSDRSGSILSTPYYLNLASNFDATLTPNLLTKRGIKLDSEFRYLTENDKGIINFEYLPSDNVANDEDRSLVSIEHTTKISENLQLSINAAEISDVDYFEDFGDSLVSSSIAALERRIDLTRTGKNWTFNTSIQDYKVLDSNDAPYSRLPELHFQYTPKRKIGNTQYFFETELVKFDKDNATTGLRFDINTVASKRYGDPGWYLEPSFQLRHTQYSLDNNDLKTDNSPSRSLPTASIDAGLFFERGLKSSRKIQTLEPRILYTYTPYKDQSDIPVFDSAATSFSTSTRLFSKNRFTGKDRIGDTNQLTMALTTRLLNPRKGREVLTASIGQIFFLNDRRVTLPGDPIETSSNSELALELAGKLNKNTRLITSTYWDTEKKQASSTEFRLHYKDANKRAINLAYRNLHKELEQVELSFATPLNDSWSLVGKLERDLKNNRVLETLGGVEYSNCCWKARLVARRFLTSDNVTYDNVPFFEFELKGLGNLGTGATNVLEEQIYGYNN